ncbi:SpoIVB peptidase S55 domain-containing protein [Sporomusa rhizae]|uniref:SpoIVB peptidase S55 domain-containing protein n=1 Tax=Sporomusa rhizae TaxID=357999 RepID=UPI00352A7D70
MRRCLAALLAVCFMLPIAYVQAAPDFLPVDQITKGMHGIAKTVVSGKEIEEFGVEVLGVMKQKGPAGDLILVRTYGDVIDRTGGIAQGMSGSPVYINGKLVGAIAYGWSLTDHRIGMVTPIADMLKLWEINDRQAPLESKQFQEEPAEPVATPLMATGFGEQALKMLTDKLKPYNLVPYAVGGSMSDDNNGIAYRTVEPGSTVGVQLVRGDFSLGALGTVTYVEGDKILAFGHPFLKRGKANYFLTDTEVYTTLSGLENSFKVGTSTEAIGMINQDRGAGIAGQLGQFPGIIPLRITVTDKNLGRTNELWAQVVQNEEMGPTLSAVSVFNAIEKTTDRLGSGTAKVGFEISAAGIPGESLKRENMFYTQGNIGELAVAEIHEALTLLAGNQYNSVDIMDVKVNVTIDSERRTATILEAKAGATDVKPGDTIDIAVKIKPYRSEPVTRHISYTVPQDQQEGTLMLAVRGGGMISVAQLMGKRQVGEDDISKLFIPKVRPKSLEDAVKDLVNRDRNNDIVVEAVDMAGFDGAFGNEGKGTRPVTDKFETTPSPALKEPTVKKSAKSSSSQNKNIKNTKSDEDKRKVYITTDYIIDGDTQLVLNVVK